MSDLTKELVDFLRELYPNHDLEAKTGAFNLARYYNGASEVDAVNATKADELLKKAKEAGY